MAVNINRVVISGNLTRDPDEKRTQGGTCILEMGVAVNDRRKNSQTGEWEDYANFIDCVMFGKRAESVAQYLEKGTAVMIDGKLRYESWERDGQKRGKVRVIVDEISFSNKRGQQQQPDPEPADEGSSIYDDDIPF